MSLLTNIISYYKLDNTTDSAGSNTLTNNGTATFVAGKIGNGVNVNGSNQYLSKAGSYGITFGSSYTFGGWVKLNAEITSGTWVLFNLNHAAGGADTSLIRYEFNAGTKRLKFVRYNSGAVDTEPLYNVSLGSAAYHHIMVTYDSATTRMDLYVDGTSVVNTTSSNTLGTTGTYTQGFEIGGDAAGTTATNAILDEVGVWSRALSSTEIASLYNGGVGFQYPFSSNSSGFLTIM